LFLRKKYQCDVNSASAAARRAASGRDLGNNRRKGTPGHINPSRIAVDFTPQI
jgi:hypothetical protein